MSETDRTRIELTIPMETPEQAIARYRGDPREVAIAAMEDRDGSWRQAVSQSLGDVWAEAYRIGRGDGLAVSRRKRLERDADGRIVAIVEETAPRGETATAPERGPVGFASTTKREEAP